MNNTYKISIYKIISYGFLVIIIFYIAIGQWIIANHINTESKWLSLFTGPPRLQVLHNVLKLQLKPDSTVLELQFMKPLDGPVRPLELKNGKLDYEVSLSAERDWLTIKAIHKKSLQNTAIALALTDPQKAGYIIRRYIKTVKIDHNHHSIPDLYYNLLSIASSNAGLYYPFELSNLSGFLAGTFGNKFVFLIVSFLLVLFLSQLLIFIVSIVWQPEQVKDYFNDPEATTAITLIDNLANRFAIPLGFLGTVVAVWYSLEETQTDYRSFFQILQIVKLAIFTTVIGLTTKVLCIIRGHYRGIFSRRLRNKE